MKRELNKLSAVVPAYNEQEVLPMFCERITAVLEPLGCDYEIILVDDGSRDDTWKVILEECSKDSHIRGLRFARNFGHQLAVTAGMDAASGDALVVIDADLQDPPEVIVEMVEKWKEGFDVVYGKRKKREGETLFKKLTAFMYYRLLKSMSGTAIPLDTGDFRLLDKRVADVMGKMREHNRFLRGLSAWTGFSQCPVEYVRHERAAGKTKYTLKKMFKLAADGIIGYSSKPLTMAFFIGGGAIGLTLASMVALLVVQLINGFSLLPWLLALLFLLCGTTLAFMGVIGAYVARIYDEAKNRPLYIISEHAGTELQP